MSEVTEFCKEHMACESGATWASQFETLAEVYDKCERGGWMIWMLQKADKLDKPTAVKIAIECAEHVLHFYEDKYPDDKRPRLAIDAARKYLSDPNEENRKAAAYAADAADAAAAAYAAYAAYAADAADAVAYADAAAYAASAYADERKWQAKKIREIVGENPFK
jgi:hypothetical protein